LIAEETQWSVAGQVRAELVGPMQVRGQRDPVVVYKITGRGRRRSRFEISAERRLTKLVGRRGELALTNG
jgi:hypothetical protein